MPSQKNGKRIGLYVTEDRKDRWDKYVDNSPEVDTMSGLVRVGVETYMSRGESEPESAPTDTASDETMVSILDALQSMNERLSVLENEQGSGDGPDLERVVFELLPTQNESDGIYATDLARKINADVGIVRETLEDLSYKSTAVWGEEDESGRTGYYRVGSSQ